MLWIGISEVKGRKIPYIIILSIFCVASAACAVSKSIGMFIAFRILQALGSSSVLLVGAASLCDIFAPGVRGMKIGIYYAVPLLGPSLGPLVGGAITSIGSWRDTFWFVVAYGAICLLLMIWMPETYRPERSMAWQAAAKRSRQQQQDQKVQSELTKFTMVLKSSPDHTLTPPTPAQLEKGFDVTKMPNINFSTLVTKFSKPGHLKDLDYDGGMEDVIEVTLRDANPFPAIGSIAGGRYSDSMLRRLKEANDGVAVPEMRIKSTHIPLFILPPFFIIYAWLVQSHQPIDGIILVLFILGLATIWIYSSTLAYLVDSNTGRSGSAVACNSLIRGLLAAIASQVSEPLIQLIGNGWFYTGFSALILVGEILLIVVGRNGAKWRAEVIANEKQIEEELVQ